MYDPVADPVFELRRGPGSILLAQPAFFLQPFLLFSPKKEGGPAPLGLSPRSATVISDLISYQKLILIILSSVSCSLEVIVLIADAAKEPEATERSQQM